MSTDSVDAKEAVNLYRNAMKNRDQQDDLDEQLEEIPAENLDTGSINEESKSEQGLDFGPPDNLQEIGPSHGSQQVLESKMDTVIHMLNKLSSKIEQPRTVDIPDMSVMLQEQMRNDDLDSKIDWGRIDNIINLTTKVPSVRFFAGQDGQKGCVRCQVCFDYHYFRDSGLRKSDPSEADDNGQAAAKHIRKYYKPYDKYINQSYRSSFQSRD